MKKKTLLQKSLAAGILIGFMFCSSNAFSQGAWRKGGNYIWWWHDKGILGTKNSKPLDIVTNDSTRMSIDETGNSVFEKDLWVKGDLSVGEQSFHFLSNEWAQGPGLTDIIGSGVDFTPPAPPWAIGQISMSPVDWDFTQPNVEPAVMNDLPFSLSLGGSHHRHKLHLEDQTPADAFSPAIVGFTNPVTNHGQDDGLIMGMEDGSLNALMNLRENGNIHISTGDGANNAQRMLIRGEDAANQGFVAIGQNFNNPLSLLSVDGSDDNTGEVFRTNGSNADTAIWRFCQGNNEIAHFYSLADSKDFIIGVEDASSALKINTGLLQKVIIKDSYGNAHVGIGNNFSHPKHNLHLHSTAYFPGAPIPSTQLAFTNDYTKSAKTDGFIVGISSTGEAQLNQQENQSMSFYTSNQEQLRITENGKLIIASLASDTTTYIMADKNGQLHTEVSEMLSG